jgi:DNA-binding NarL/FixJ family response regulator
MNLSSALSPTPPPTRVLLVEDHAMFREQLARLISQEFGMEICGQTDNIRDALTLARSARPDIALIDISLKGASGLELLKDWKAQGMKFPTLVLSMHEESLYADRVLAAGARGYITKHANSETLLQAIQRVLDGKIYVSEQMMENLVSKMAGRSAGASPVERLADRELEVFQLIGAGRSTREIAETLNLGMTTVDTYRTRIKDKLGLANGTELIKAASRWVLEGV